MTTGFVPWPDPPRWFLDKPQPAPVVGARAAAGRRNSPPRPGICYWCGEFIEGRQSTAKYCSTRCQSKAAKARHDAKYGPKKKCVVRGCNKKSVAKGWCRTHYPTNDQARARHRGVAYEVFVRDDVYDRDGWICGICSLPVDRKLKAPDLMRVSLDHIIPFSRGGDHTPDNVQCSHLICNIRKGSSLPG
jgi:hypothetical protein